MGDMDGETSKDIIIFIYKDYRMNEKKANRNSNIELLRIIAMILIVISHYSVFSQADIDGMSLGFNKFLLDSTNYGLVGVALFEIITGYYLIELDFKTKRVVNIISQTLFYTVGFFVLFCIIDRSNFSIMQMINNMFPIIRRRYWYISAYVILLFIFPFINKALKSITRKQFVSLLAVLVFYFSIAASFFNFKSVEFGGRLGFMIYYYLIGAYLRMYPNNFLSKKQRSAALSFVSFVLMTASVAIINLVGTRLPAFAGKAKKFYSLNSVLVLILAACLVAFFVNLKPKHSSLINRIGGCTLGVYLIHENPFVRKWLWVDMFNNSAYAESSMLVVHFVISVIIVYSTCTVIEYVRKYLIEKYVFAKVLEYINAGVEKIYKKLNICIEKSVVKIDK